MTNHQRTTESRQTRSQPRQVYLARILLYVNAVAWLVLTIVSLLRLAGRSGPALTPLIVAILMVGNAVALALGGFLLGRPRRLWYLAVLALLGVNILLTFTDQFGFPDLLTLLVDLAAAGLLFTSRARSFYFSRPEQPD